MQYQKNIVFLLVLNKKKILMHKKKQTWEFLWQHLAYHLAKLLPRDLLFNVQGNAFGGG